LTAAKFKAQDEAHAKALAEKDELAAAKDAEIAKLKTQITAAQAAKTKTDDHDYSEAETRRLFIDVMLAEAGWLLDQARDREYPVTGMPNSDGTGFVDYVLWGADALPLAVVEAKRTTKSAQVGQQQAKLYADCLEAEFGRRPVVFYTNGYEHWIWDDAAGYPPREIQGFYTRDELKLLIQRCQTQLDLKEHEDHVALQKLRRNKQLTPEDLASLSAMLIASGGDQQVDLAWVEDEPVPSGPSSVPSSASTARQRAWPSPPTSTRRSSPSIKCASCP